MKSEDPVYRGGNISFIWFSIIPNSIQNELCNEHEEGQ